MRLHTFSHLLHVHLASLERQSRPQSFTRIQYCPSSCSSSNYLFKANARAHPHLHHDFLHPIPTSPSTDPFPIAAVPLPPPPTTQRQNHQQHHHRQQQPHQQHPNYPNAPKSPNSPEAPNAPETSETQLHSESPYILLNFFSIGMRITSLRSPYRF